MVGKNVERKEGRLFKRVFRGGGEDMLYLSLGITQEIKNREKERKNRKKERKNRKFPNGMAVQMKDG